MSELARLQLQEKAAPQFPLAYRTDIKLLSKLPLSTVLPKANKDLWCPFDISPRFDSEEVFSVKRQERVGEAALEASLNAAERNALKALSKPSPKQKTSKVVSIGKKKSQVEQLKEDSAWFDENS